MIASVRANPSHWMLVISSRISGWRVTDSITFPKMNPTPMPGPTVPRPAPTPKAIALSPSSDTWAIGSRMSSIVVPPSPLSVTSGACLAEVDGCERGEDEGLQRGNQPDLEDEEGDRDRQRDPPERCDAQQYCEPAAHEQDQQVAGQDVCEQPDRQGD